MVTQIELGDITADVVQGHQNIHLSATRRTAGYEFRARGMSLDTIRVFAISKLGWIKQQQGKLQEQERETPRGIWTARAITFGGTATCSRWSKPTKRHPLSYSTARSSCKPAQAPMKRKSRPSWKNGIASSSSKPRRR